MESQEHCACISRVKKGLVDLSLDHSRARPASPSGRRGPQIASPPILSSSGLQLSYRLSLGPLTEGGSKASILHIKRLFLFNWGKVAQWKWTIGLTSSLLQKEAAPWLTQEGNRVWAFQKPGLEWEVQLVEHCRRWKAKLFSNHDGNLFFKILMGFRILGDEQDSVELPRKSWTIWVFQSLNLPLDEEKGNKHRTLAMWQALWWALHKHCLIYYHLTMSLWSTCNYPTIQKTDLQLKKVTVLFHMASKCVEWCWSGLWVIDLGRWSG